MTYETKSGSRYTVEMWINNIYQIERSVIGLRGTRHLQARQNGLRRDFPDRKSAESALKAYADAHPGWKVVEG